MLGLWIELLTCLCLQDSEHLFDHVYESGVKSQPSSPRVKSKSEPGTPPSTLPKSTNSDLEALKDTVPVVNKDTGEKMNLQFLEELNSQCHVFSPDSTPSSKIPQYLTPQPKSVGEDFDNHKEFWSDLRQDRKKKGGMFTKLNGVRKKIHVPKFSGAK